MSGRIAKQITIEQRRGRQKYGNSQNDFAYDDSHTYGEWQEKIIDHAETLNCFARSQGFRHELVKIAALAVSAIEAFDRRAKRTEKKSRE